MTPIAIVLLMTVYFGILFLISHFVSKNNTGNEAFFKALEKHESHFQTLLAKASEKNCRLKYVAQLENGKASVGLQEIDPSHDLIRHKVSVCHLLKC